MGLDMYLSAVIEASDPDPRVQAVFAVISQQYPGGVPKRQEYPGQDEGQPLWLPFRGDDPEDPRITRVRAAIAQHFPVVSASNHWIGGYFSDERITIPLAYWRKANQIHAWFVRETQGGLDECRPSEVTREQLYQLHKLVQRVEKNQALAHRLLPVQEGFFFGSTDYGTDYFADIEGTRRMLDRIAEYGLTERTKVIYEASW